MEQKPVEQLLQTLDEQFQAGRLVKITLSKQRDKSSDLLNLIISPVNIRAGMMLHCIYRYKTRDISKNLNLDETKTIIREVLETDFLQLDMYVVGQNLKLIINKRGNSRLIRSSMDTPMPVSFAHDRQKERILPAGEIPWMRGLGLVNEQGTVRNEMKDKYLQINRYIEILAPEIGKLGLKDPLHVVDMGSGKGYLTFALYDYLTQQLSRKTSITGIEFRKDLVDLSNQVASASGFKGLQFTQGAIGETDIPACDILIALHACDTATDEAIYKGMQMQAGLIVCAPCCQKQVRKSMSMKGGLQSILKHGILFERQAELLTDGLRAMIMEAGGYKTRVMEFIDTDHTAKNIMIIGRKTAIPEHEKEKTKDTIRQLMQMFGIEKHYLQELLEERATKA